MTVDYDSIIQRFPWVAQRDLNCILSPDSDGFLCGLLMTNVLGWSVSGFYDGKVLLLENGLRASDCVFLDMDINRGRIRSVGHHMVVYNKRLRPELEAAGYLDYSNCVQPNNLRDFDGKNDFQRKYPLGTIHLLLGVLQRAFPKELTIRPEGLWPLLFTDGVWNNLFGYTENCLDWIEWLGITERNHVLNPFFCTTDMTFYQIMQGLNSFLRVRDKYNASGTCRDGQFIAGGGKRRTGDKFRMSDSHGEPINLVPDTMRGTFRVHDNERGRIVGFVGEMSDRMGWPFQEARWRWGGFSVTRFEKGDFSRTKLNNATYREMLSRRPFSMAMTSAANVEYTTEISR